ncbi:MAG: hypothetical protein HN389_12660 [Clostridia bacterium]|jgi:hypothetical protein|nr:hypothetical protein [Clostridia bacterium]
MKEFIKKHIDRILIITGVVVAVVGNVVGWALGIPLTFSLYAAILLLFTIGFIGVGLIFLSNRIKAGRPKLSKAIRYLVVFFGLIMLFVDIAWFASGIIDLLIVAYGA